MTRMSIRIGFLALSAITSGLQAQNPIDIPSEIIILEEQHSIGGGAKHYFLCRDSEVKVVSGLHQLYVSSGSIVEIYGGSPTIYSEDGSEVMIYAGTPNLKCCSSGSVTWKNANRNRISIPCIPAFTVSRIEMCGSEEIEAKIESIDSLAHNPTPIDSLVIEDRLVSPQQEEQVEITESISDKKLKIIEIEDSSMPEFVHVPAQCIEISEPAERTEFKKKIHLMAGRLTLTGEKNEIYVSSGAEIVLFGSGNKIQAENGSIIVVGGRERNTIHHSKGAKILIEGESTAVDVKEHENLILIPISSH